MIKKLIALISMIPLTTMGMQLVEHQKKLHNYMHDLFANDTLTNIAQYQENILFEANKKTELYLLTEKQPWLQSWVRNPKKLIMLVGKSYDSTGSSHDDTPTNNQEGIKAVQNYIAQRLQSTLTNDQKLFFGIMLNHAAIVEEALKSGAQGEAIPDDPIAQVTGGADPIFYLATLQKLYEQSTTIKQTNCNEIIALLAQNRPELFLKRRNMNYFTTETPLSILYNSYDHLNPFHLDNQALSGFQIAQKQCNFIEENWKVKKIDQQNLKKD